MSSLSKHSNQQKQERLIATTRTISIDIKVVATSPMQSKLVYNYKFPRIVLLTVDGNSHKDRVPRQPTVDSCSKQKTVQLNT